MAQPQRRKVDQSLQYRWGIVGAVLAIMGLFWFAETSGILKRTSETHENPNVKIVCPRCGGEAAKKINCAFCNGKGFIWVDKTKYLPEEVVPAQ